MARDNQHNDIQNKIEKYSEELIKSKNIILHGAPGTGKSYLAKKIAAHIISDGEIDDYNQLTDEQKEQVEFVQFHPSYDYTDFVEGLRPTINDNDNEEIKFELKDGIFKEFVDSARKNYEDSQKSSETLENERIVDMSIDEFLNNLDFNKTYKTKSKKSEFSITSFDDTSIHTVNKKFSKHKPNININNLRKLLLSKEKIDSRKDVQNVLHQNSRNGKTSYILAIYKEIKKILDKEPKSDIPTIKPELKKYIFIIDEINRGEISKIFGELFYSIDPDYRGPAGEISTQYANMHDDQDEKFYIPENLYIIGTMNDIDRSVDSFDFAMRRRFRFIPLKANEQTEMLDTLNNKKKGLKEKAIEKMEALNQAIAEDDDLNENYQIGAAYFLKLKTLDFDQLWTDHLEPLLQDYVRGTYDEKNKLSKFTDAYGYPEHSKKETNETTEN